MLNAKARIRLALLRIGRRMTQTQLANLNAAQSYLELGYWLKHEVGHTPEIVADDEALFSVALAKVDGARPLYLEFGVFEGRSMRWWSQHLRNPDARLVGFDSFQGLPDDWRPGLPAGTFATAGPPHIDDDRVSFQVGWFDDTLRDFAIPDHDQLIINVDADLYSSAVTVLTWAEKHLRPGSLIYFDEFPDRDHEMRAMMEFLDRGLFDLRPIAIANGGFHWLFEVVG